MRLLVSIAVGLVLLAGTGDPASSLNAELKGSSFCPGYRRFIANPDKEAFVIHFHCFAHSGKYKAVLAYILPGVSTTAGLQVQEATIDPSGNLATLEKKPAASIRGKIAIAAAFPKMRHQLKATLTEPLGAKNKQKSAVREVIFKEDYERLGGAARFDIDSLDEQKTAKIQKTGGTAKAECFNLWLEPRAPADGWLNNDEPWKKPKLDCDQFFNDHLSDIDTGGTHHYEAQKDRLVVFNQYGILIFRDFQRVYGGGAHGNYTTTYHIYDVTRRFRLTLAKHLIAAGKESGFLKLIQAKLEKNVFDKPPLKDLKMPYTALTTPEGLLVQYQTYTVASFAEGEVGAFLLWSDVWPLISRRAAKSLKPLLVQSRHPENVRLCRKIRFCK